MRERKKGRTQGASASYEFLFFFSFFPFFFLFSYSYPVRVDEVSLFTERLGTAHFLFKQRPRIFSLVFSLSLSHCVCVFNLLIHGEFILSALVGLIQKILINYTS